MAQGTVAATGPSFEVVSLKKVVINQDQYNSSSAGIAFGPQTKPCEYLPDRVRCQLVLQDLIEEAYQIKGVEMVAPKWLDEDVFSIEATMPVGTSRDTARLMLRQALADRFGLRVHREKRDTTVYALIADKLGVRLLEADDPAHRKLKDVSTPVGSLPAQVYSQPGQFFAAAMTLDDLAANIGVRTDLNSPVVNLTGLTGKYKFDLHWTPPDDDHGTPTQKDPGFMAAIQKQSGLRLEKRKVLYDVLVVDHIQRVPLEN
ncbi:TIGR03435 family protein [Acidicapsa ligni]|uniref:TIGR03435 family protein n=1 Tax=Acidicapsa ligni TaxID=542300 RepID=UPI0021DFAE02|nr:TIGR03435 family protein [Acidicapsa ligni]